MFYKLSLRDCQEKIYQAAVDRGGEWGYEKRGTPFFSFCENHGANGTSTGNGNWKRTVFQ
jgi:hypothetical protein